MTIARTALTKNNNRFTYIPEFLFFYFLQYLFVLTVFLLHGNPNLCVQNVEWQSGKMGPVEAINYAITIVILICVMFVLTGFLITKGLSAADKPARPLVGMVARLFKNVCIVLLTVILVTFFFLWVIWRILKFLSPLTLGITGLIAKITPPFRQMERAGIFGFISEFSGCVLSLRLKCAIMSFFRFFRGVAQYIFGRVTGFSVSRTKAKIVKSIDDTAASVKSRVKGAAASAKTTATSAAATATSAKPKVEEDPDPEETNPDATEDSKYTPQEHQAVQTKIDMCITENVKPVPASLSMTEKLQMYSENSKITNSCKAKAIGYYNEIRSYK